MGRNYQAGNFSFTPQHKHILVKQNYEGHELDKTLLNHKQKIEGWVNIRTIAQQMGNLNKIEKSCHQNHFKTASQKHQLMVLVQEWQAQMYLDVNNKSYSWNERYQIKLLLRLFNYPSTFIQHKTCYQSKIQGNPWRMDLTAHNEYLKC